MMSYSVVRRLKLCRALIIFGVFCIGMSMVLGLLSKPLMAQSTLPSGTTASASPQTSIYSEEGLKSGYKQGDSLEGGDSVTQDLAQDDVDVGAVLSFPRVDQFFAPWFDFKRKLNDKYGLKLQLSYQALYQIADEYVDENDAAAGRGEFQGTWAFIGRKSKNPGLISFRFENRNTLGTEIPPTQLGREFGAAAPTGSGFNDFGFALTELAWRQTLLDGKLKFVTGKISAVSWYNAHALASAKTGFQNLALRGSLSKPGPGRGLGGGAAVQAGEHFVVLGGIHDANGSTPDNPFDTIDEGEFFTSVEFRWYPTTFERRRFDQVRLQLWHQDEREEAGIPSSDGATFVASRLINDFWMPFAFGGISDGEASTFEADFAVGLGFAFNTVHRAARDVLGLAAGWGKPADDTLQEQYTTEAFYRFQLVKNLAITPSVQYIINPSNNPEETEAWVFGLRGRLTF